MTVEREVKLSVPEGFVLPALDGVAAGVRSELRGVLHLEATYWDTPDMDLYRAGAGLRYRLTDGGAGTWTLKSGSRREGHALVREEVETPGDAEAPPGQVVRLLPGAVIAAALRPVAAIRTERGVTDLLDAGGRFAELADDRVAVLRGREVVATFHEVEVELVRDVAEEVVDAVVTALRDAGASDAGAQGKHSRALQALGLLPDPAPT